MISLEQDGIRVTTKKLQRNRLAGCKRRYGVFEFYFRHLRNPQETAVEIARLLKPGGITAHFIDIEDHSDFANPFNYLIYSDEEWEARFGDEKKPEWAYENRWRASDFHQFFAASGLSLVNCERLRSAEISDELLERIAPRFKEYNREDLQTVWLMIVAAKPANQPDLDRPPSGKASSPFYEDFRQTDFAIDRRRIRLDLHPGCRLA